MPYRIEGGTPVYMSDEVPVRDQYGNLIGHAPLYTEEYSGEPPARPTLRDGPHRLTYDQMGLWDDAGLAPGGVNFQGVRGPDGLGYTDGTDLVCFDTGYPQASQEEWMRDFAFRQRHAVYLIARGFGITLWTGDQTGLFNPLLNPAPPPKTAIDRIEMALGDD